jgi:hypothetical protein
VSPQLEISHGSAPARPDLIDRIASALPDELRADYYRELAHCRQLPENDEMLRILRAMQFLVVLIEQAPERVAAEREQLGEVLGRAIESIRVTHEAGIAYQKQLETRIAKLPDEIARGISPEAIAAKIGESLRQEFQHTGMPAVTEAIGAQAATMRRASKELSEALGEFAHPTKGAAPRVKETLSSMKANLESAADHIRTQMNGLGRQLYETIAVFCVAALIIGFFAGIFYDRWLDTPAQPQSAPPAVQSISPSSSPAMPAPSHNKRLPAKAPRQAE